MNRSPWTLFSFKLILLSIFGLSALPFLSVVVQYLDTIVNVNGSPGYHTSSSDYLLEWPLLPLVVILGLNLILGILLLAYHQYKEKQNG